MYSRSLAMKSNFRKIGDYIQLVDKRNKDLEVSQLLGLSISKQFISSVANTIGTNMKNYKIISKNQFACSLMQVRRDKKMPVALLNDFDEAIISQAYPVFEIIDTNLLLPEYLMMWFSRSEFDRHACFLAVGGVRGSLEWEDFLEMELPVPTVEKQNEIIKEYNTIVNRIKLNEQLNQKLEETAQAIYKHWFVDFEFPNKDGKPYKSSGGKMVYNEELDKEVPEGWEKSILVNIADIIMGQSPSGESYNEDGIGELFYQGRTEFGFRFPSVKMYTSEPKRRASKGDILMSVRAPVGDLNIANNDCCIGRGVASLKSKINCNSFLYYLMIDVKNQFNVSNDEGTIFGSITKDGLYEIEVIKADNKTILSFNDVIKNIDNSIVLYCNELVFLNEMKDLILSKMSKVELDKEVKV
ncbi:MAG: restriction endonuclease subunit S [Flavobacteriaceae bacterium]|nr:restriction endonuclease subunit S [Flavobacteriaceae bacterium]